MLRAANQARVQCSRIVRTPRPAATWSSAVSATFCRYQSTIPPPDAGTPSVAASAEPHIPPPPSPPSSSSSPATPSRKAAPKLGSPEAWEENPDLNRYLRDLTAYRNAPDLMETDPLVDPAIVHNIPPTQRSPHENQIILRNRPGLFDGYDALLEELGETKEEMPSEGGEGNGLDLLPYTSGELRSLHRYPLVVRRITQQTGKGKQHRTAAIIVVGNGDGLVGMGMGKHEDVPVANDKAFLEAVKNMDYVDRFENRTVWTELSIKFGSTQVILRPRPVGFGLHCNPYIHQILKAAGIKDCSAKVWGSRNPVNVIMATLKLLHAGNAPLGMGDGIGGRGRRMEKGTGMRSAGDVERERGRKLTCLRTV